MPLTHSFSEEDFCNFFVPYSKAFVRESRCLYLSDYQRLAF